MRARESAPRRTGGEKAEAAPLPQTVSPASIPSGQSFGTSLPQDFFPTPAMSRRTCGNPIIHVDLFFPMRRHTIIPGANGPVPAVCDEIRDEIVRIADRIQAIENPDFSPAEAADRWLDRLSPVSPIVWELRDVLNASVLYCQTFGTYLIRSGNGEMAARFDAFALQFDILRKECFPSLPRGTEGAEDAPRRRSVESSAPPMVKAGESKPANHPPETKKRGRPSTIPIERKVAAAKCKAEGGSNNDIAALIYDTPYPSNQQKKNVPSIFNHFAKKMKKSPVTPAKNRLKPNKTKG
jgi:hypothetical protein